MTIIIDITMASPQEKDTDGLVCKVCVEVVLRAIPNTSLVKHQTVNQRDSRVREVVKKEGIDAASLVVHEDTCEC